MIATVTSALAGPLGYLTLAGLVAGESTGVPLPGETALLAAALLAHHGRLDITTVIAVAALAAVLGDNAGYWLGRTGARRLFEAAGPLQAHRRHLLEHGERFFARHGPKAVFLARFAAGARVTAAWLAGANHMPWRRFLVWNAAGGITWALIVGVSGYLLGTTAEQVVRQLGLGALGALAAAALIAAGLLIARRRRRPPSLRRRR